MGRAFVKAFLCAGAGALAWILCEPFFPKVLTGSNFSTDLKWRAVEGTMNMLLGMFIGTAAGWLHGAERGGRRNVLIAAALGLIFGAVGASFGHTIGSALYVMFGGGINSPTDMVARTAAFTPWGLMIGLAVGASQRSTRSLMAGGIGGLIAGFTTGALFNPITTVLAGITSPGVTAEIREVGAPGRAFLAFGMGLFIGLFTALVDLASRKAWIRLVLGRNEGKEWPLDAAQTLIGRDERAHVPLFGDPGIPQLAAVIERRSGQYVLRDPGSPLGVGHNGVRVPEAVLRHGDAIQIGPLNFQFMMRAGGAAAAEGRAKGVPVGGLPMGGPVAPVQPQPVPTQTFASPAPYGQPAPMNQTQAYTPVGQTQVVATPAVLTLVVMTGPLTGHRVAVNGPVEIGREAPGLALGHDVRASRRHATVSPGPGGLQVADLGSTNGTYVNGQRVQTALVRPGDVVTVGSTQLRVE